MISYHIGTLLLILVWFYTHYFSNEKTKEEYGKLVPLGAGFIIFGILELIYWIIYFCFINPF